MGRFLGRGAPEAKLIEFDQHSSIDATRDNMLTGMMELSTT